jgi:transcription elongation factor Elf1
MQADKYNFAYTLDNSETREGGYTCSDCGASFSTHEGLVNHNVDVHGAAVGAQLRQSEEIQKQRREE